jgi:hypothetical protein
MELKLPTEIIELPSKGILYAENDPLSQGKIELKYMGAKEEDILTNENYIREGTVLDRLLKSMIVTPINFDNLLLGDLNAILISARILGYGKNYNFTHKNKSYTVDLSSLRFKNIDYSIFKKGINELPYSFNATNNVITFKLLTHKDDILINQEIKGLNRINPEGSFRTTTKLKYTITSINGNRDLKSISDFVTTQMLAVESLELRRYIKSISPDIDLTYYPEDYVGEGIEIPIDVDFFWPE